MIVIVLLFIASAGLGLTAGIQMIITYSIADWSHEDAVYIFGRRTVLAENWIAFVSWAVAPVLLAQVLALS